MAYYSDNHAIEEFVSPATQARFEKTLATSQSITGNILSICREISEAMEAVAIPVTRRARVRRTATVLHGLSDRQLADIGVARAEIDVVAHGSVKAQVGHHHV